MLVTGGDELTRTRKNYIKDIVEADGTVHIVLESECKYLVGNKCLIYENRPQRCKDFPKGEESRWKLVCPECTMCD